jgi:hypothetical protein
VSVWARASQGRPNSPRPGLLELWASGDPDMGWIANLMNMSSQHPANGG